MTSQTQSNPAKFSTPIVNSEQPDSLSMDRALASVLRNFDIESERLIPCKVISFDRASNLAAVQPLIYWIDQSNKTRKRPPVANVNVLSLGGGGFHISFPCAQGDLGWIFAGERDLDLFKKSLDLAAPASGRIHKFADGLLIPDVFRKYAIAAEDSAAMVIQSVDGSTKVSIRDGDILIAAPNKLVVRVPSTEFDGDVTVKGFTNVNGGFSATGGEGLPCDLPDTATIGGTNVLGHGHISSSPGTRTADGMIP